MSLINDALKRAKQAQQLQQQQQSPPAAAPMALPPVASAHRPGPGAFFFALLSLLVIAALSFIGLAIAQHKPQILPAAAPRQFAQVVHPPVASNPPPAPAATTQLATVVLPPPPAPALKLQGILIGSDRPQAIVNGQSVGVGDTINGFRVTVIAKNNVSFIGPDGSQKTLTLGR